MPTMWDDDLQDSLSISRLPSVPQKRAHLETAATEMADLMASLWSLLATHDSSVNRQDIKPTVPHPAQDRCMSDLGSIPPQRGHEDSDHDLPPVSGVPRSSRLPSNLHITRAARTRLAARDDSLASDYSDKSRSSRASRSAA